MAGYPIGPGGDIGGFTAPTTSGPSGVTGFPGPAAGPAAPGGFQGFLAAIPRLLGKNPEEQTANANALSAMFKGLSTQIGGLNGSTLDKNIQQMHAEDSMAQMETQFASLQDPFLAAELLKTLGISGAR